MVVVGFVEFVQSNAISVVNVKLGPFAGVTLLRDNVGIRVEVQLDLAISECFYSDFGWRPAGHVCSKNERGRRRA